MSLVSPKHLVLLSASVLLMSAYADESPSQQLESLLGGVSTLQADVDQLILESDGGVLEESSIRMQLKKPDGFYWETIDPFPELIVTNGLKLWNYQPDLEQVVIEDWNSDQSELAAQLLSGNTDSLSEDYAVEVDGLISNVLSFTLSPLSSDSVYETISIRFMDAQLEAIHLNAKNGEQTVWQFNNLKSNLPLADSLFVFEPPEGIEVIENTYVQ